MELGKKDTKIGKFIFMVLCIFMSFSVFIAGCSSQPEVIKVGGDVITGQAVSEDSSTQTDNSAVVEDENKSKDKKPEQQVMQESLSKVIADGTYTNKATYQYHSGNETIEIKVSVKDDIVTGASVTGINPHKVSAKFISGVNAELPNLVVGKKINEINLPKQISGSSLTTAAFKKQIDDLIEKY
ncbi:hypothetical protein J4401_02690 [Candidatus Woesearchaeota archaeon]|nr:hypothetical protein [Candidatus Woesearchaeota archaeon]